MKHIHGKIFPALVALCLEIIPAAAVAQETPSACQDVLAAPPFYDMLTRNDGGDFAQLHARSQGAPLIGLSCSLEALVEYFEAAGWELIESSSYEPKGPLGNEFAYHTDATAIFCQKSRRMINFFFLKCTRAAGFNFYEGKISFVRAGARN